jgi:hypothetical protein
MIPLTDESTLNTLRTLDCEEMIHSKYYTSISTVIVHFFEETPPISSYIYGLFAGRFKCFVDEDVQDKIQMRIFAS